MLVEILIHLVALDLGWFINFFIGNLLWVAILLTLGYYVFGGDLKHFLIGTIILTINIFAWFDFGAALGVPLFVGSFLLLNYVLKLSSLAIAIGHEKLKYKLVYINEILVIGLVIIYLIFVAGG